MFRLTLLLNAIFITGLLSAQDLHVYYNAFTDSVHYMVEGKPVDRPLVSKGNEVVLHVYNYNNYLYRLEVKTDEGQNAVSKGRAFDLSSLLQVGGFNPVSLMLGGGEDPGGLAVPEIIPIEEISGFAGDTKEAQAQQALIREMQKLESSFKNTQESLAALDEDMSGMHQKIQTALEVQQIQMHAADAIQRLRYTPLLEPRQIKALSQEYMVHIFGEKDPQKLSLSKVIQKAGAEKEAAGLRQEYHKKLSAYEGKVELLKFNHLALQDKKFDFGGSNIDGFRSAAQNYVASAEENLGAYQSNAILLDSALSSVNDLDLATLTDLRTTYLVMMENDFTQTSRHTVTGDHLNLKIHLTPIDSVEIPGLATKNAAPIELTVYGGLQIRGGVGVSFGGFFKQPNDYFVRDSIIHSSSKDVFSPYLTSFIHFYRQSRSSASFGGSFGVGIPIGGNSGLEAIAFFLGPSLVMGRDQGIVLSGGLFGGKANQLSGGYSVGDYFDADAGLLKTESVYRMGYFLGVSFNLIGKKN